jgi:hypothetical protein
MELSPHAFLDMDEEALRSHFLVPNSMAFMKGMRLVRLSILTAGCKELMPGRSIRETLLVA